MAWHRSLHCLWTEPEEIRDLLTKAPYGIKRDFIEYRISDGQVNLRLVVAEGAVLIVVSTWVESEIWGRWDYRLAWELRRRGIWRSHYIQIPVGWKQGYPRQSVIRVIRPSEGEEDAK